MARKRRQPPAQCAAARHATRHAARHARIKAFDHHVRPELLDIRWRIWTHRECVEAKVRA
eukprot:scaffold12581_cov49-Phaeocystis_antarctica.AAC.2